MLQENKDNEYNWLVPEQELADIKNQNDYYTFDFFMNNGIITESLAETFMYNIRFKHSNLDCPNCGIVAKHYILKSRLHAYKCKKCGKKFSITSGTYIDNTKLPYFLWFRFAYLIGTMKTGFKSPLIARDLNITQKTSFYMIRSLRNVSTKDPLDYSSHHEVMDCLLKIKRK